MVLGFYCDLLSQPCRAVYIFLKMNKIPFEVKSVSLLRGVHINIVPIVIDFADGLDIEPRDDHISGDNHNKDFRKVSPIGRLPVIEDGGFILTECVAILKYLAVKYNVPDHWYPRTDLKAQARIDEYMNYQHLNTRTNMAMLFQNLWLLPMMLNRPIDRKKVDRYSNNVGVVIHQIDEYFLKDNRPFIAGDNISLADLLGLCEMMQLYACCQEKFIESNPKVNAWAERVKLKLAPYFDEANVEVNITRDKFLKSVATQPKL